THASLLLNTGIPYKELQYRLGHSTLSMTMDIYSHLSKENAKKAVSFFETAINSI
ncbi:MAG: tyrosine-type recombinase/integrase, partial [Streptococcus agalactiae]|nr:tyrosine-type recombinase/integrase [Streptococcus agalactiae]